MLQRNGRLVALGSTPAGISKAMVPFGNGAVKSSRKAGCKNMTKADLACQVHAPDSTGLSSDKATVVTLVSGRARAEDSSPVDGGGSSNEDSTAVEMGVLGLLLQIVQTTRPPHPTQTRCPSRKAHIRIS
jgi:hypothetical protein